MASGLSRRVTEIEAAVSLLGYFHDRLRYLQPTVSDLIDGACGLESLGNNRFLPVCRDSMRQGVPFPGAWRESVAQNFGELDREETALLSSLGQVLGSADLDSQVDAIACVRARMEARLEQARSYRERHQKLYSTLGLLTGAAVVILLI